MAGKPSRPQARSSALPLPSPVDSDRVHPVVWVCVGAGAAAVVILILALVAFRRGDVAESMSSPESVAGNGIPTPSNVLRGNAPESKASPKNPARHDVSKPSQVSGIVSALAVKRRIGVHAERFAEATVKRDYRTVVAYLPKEFVAMAGGVDQAQKQFQRVLGEFQIQRVQTEPVSSIAKGDGVWLAVVPTTTVGKLHGESVRMEGFLFAESTDDGETCTFLEGNSTVIGDYQKERPELVRQLKFPQRRQVLPGKDPSGFDMVMIEVDGKWVPDEKTSQRLNELADENPKLQDAVATVKAFREKAVPYKNAKYGFKILFPEKWQVKSSVLSPNTIVKAVKKTPEGKIAMITIAAYPVSENEEVSELSASERFTAFKAEYPGVDAGLLDSGQTIIAGKRAVWIKVEVKSPPIISMIAVHHHFRRGRTLFRVTTMTDRDSAWFQQHEKEFRHSVHSMEFY